MQFPRDSVFPDECFYFPHVILVESKSLKYLGKRDVRIVEWNFLRRRAQFPLFDDVTDRNPCTLDHWLPGFLFPNDIPVSCRLFHIDLKYVSRRAKARHL